ncbi:MAG: cysteine desulfurase [Parcubacteria group bacterium]|nr:cysteine desulfurase [Parcubacteria group bacterium]
MVLKDYKSDFPIFENRAKRGQLLIYLDSAATAQMPQRVLDTVRDYEETSRANVHRGIYALSEEATQKYEEAREKVRQFINARYPEEIIFTRNATESIDLVAHSLGKTFFKESDHILVSRAEHHSNFLPWQMLGDEKGVILDIIDVDESGEISLEEVENASRPETKLAAFAHISHVLGTINPINEMARHLREQGILFLVDAAQSAAHLPIDVQKIGCDFLVFSGHKMGAPTGIGVLYGRREILEIMPPFLRGGGMIREVSIEETKWHDLPWKFEAGTPNVSGAIGLAAAVDYVKEVGFEEIRRIDEELGRAALERLKSIPSARIYGPSDPKERGGVVSFSIDGIHPHDLATTLDRDGVCIRAGHHCAMPLMKWLGVPATARASFWIYNCLEDVERLIEGIEKAIRILSKTKNSA